MCGINGIVQLQGSDHPLDQDRLLKIRDAMAQRGPDGCGCWIDPTATAGLGHRRLAIIDPVASADQPMAWEADPNDGAAQYHIAFNGEIYNYRELRESLIAQGVSLRTNSDTEVILALFAREGIAMLSRLRGMYAFAIWNCHDQSLVLARDPLGIKPLYYAVERNQLLFASQVKALIAGGVLPQIDNAGLVGFLLWGSVPEPLTIYQSIRALPAGHYLEVRAGKVGTPSPHYHFQPGLQDDNMQSVGEAIEESVQAHLVADVPVGLFLSAGLDSALIAALASRHTGLTAFTLTFDDFAGTGQDEGPLAAKIAASLGLRHVIHRLSAQAVSELWQANWAAMDQPSIDGFNVFLMSKVAHDHGLKVVLSGLGGDELFGSYPSFRDVPRWSRAVSVLRRVPGHAALWGRLPSKSPKQVGLLRYGQTIAGAYFLRRSLFLPEEILSLIGPDRAEQGLQAYQPLFPLEQTLRDSAPRDDWEAVHVLETTYYLRNQLLRDADWASMAHSLELRVPFVDARLRDELATRHFEPARSQGKAALVRQLAPSLPPELFSRAKTGFFVPANSWTAQPARRPMAWGAGSRALAGHLLAEMPL